MNARNFSKNSVTTTSTLDGGTFSIEAFEEFKRILDEIEYPPWAPIYSFGVIPFRPFITGVSL
jgi:hypothetical protein